MSTPVIHYPFPPNTIVQRFGDNATPLYSTDGLKGHPGWDFGVPWGTPIPNCLQGAFVYSLMNKDNPTLMAYRAVFTIWDDLGSDTSYELSYGHCSAITAIVGTTPNVGDILSRVGNTGPVYAGQHEVTEAEKDAGSHAGAHLHFQLRLLKRVTHTDPTAHLIMDDKGVYMRNGFYYEVVNYDNGYNGCIDPAPFMVDNAAVVQQQIQQVTTIVNNLNHSVPVTPEEKNIILQIIQKISEEIKLIFS